MKLVGPAFPRAFLALALVVPPLAAASAPTGQVDSSHQVADDAANFYHGPVPKNGGGLLSSPKEPRALTARRTESDPGTAREGPSPSRRAFVTLLYSDFIHGTRALGQSLRETRTTADTVVLVTPDVQQDTREILKKDGWIVRPVEVEENPNANFQPRLVFVYTKLLIVEMESEYDRIVFLDADTLVLENVDELFDCGPFCAVMRHSELLNSGVVVISPSKELYSHMHELIGKLDSYTGGDQGFLNSFYPYFAACPAFEPYPIVGSRLAGIGSSVDESLGGSWRGVEEEGGTGVEKSRAGGRGGGGEGEGGRGLGEWVKPRGWGCKRLPTRYNGDWPLLFVDGDLQVVQGKEAGPEAPEDWKRRKKVKILHFTFGTAKPWDWWTYPFLPYVDLWLEAFHRAEGEGDSARRLDEIVDVEVRPAAGGGRGGGGGAGRGRERREKSRKRPRWNGVPGQIVSGLAPLAAIVVLWRVAKRWKATRQMLRKMGAVIARYAVPLKALNARSLSGSIINLAAGLALAVSAAVLAFNAVPAAKLGAARPEAAWAFFWARATALMVLSEGFYLFLVWQKAHQVFVPAPVETEAPFSSIALVNASVIPADYDGDGGGGVGSGGGGGGGLTPNLALSSPPRTVCVGMDDVVGKKAGGASAGGMCGVRRAALTETVAHLAFLSAMSASLVSAPLWVGLNGFPASREILPGLARLLALLVAFTFSAVRLPPLWAAHARAWDRDRTSHRHLRGRRLARSDWRKMEVERIALGNLSPLSDHHNA